MISLFMGLFFACKSEIDNKEPAQVGDLPKQTEKTTNVPLKKETNDSNESRWTLDPSSKVEWVGAKVTKDHVGGFNTVTGNALVEKQQLKHITADIEIASLFSDHPKLTKHLLNVDFFEVEKFAKASFKSTEISDGNIKGVLDLHGVKKEISFPATISLAENTVGIQSEFTINRRLWGINYNGRANDLIKDDVLIKLDVRYKAN
ncbi:MAG: YceI family protein [Myxococcota bacterium]|nr:YceI family protein [Myxococcota bacterium]